MIFCLACFAEKWDLLRDSLEKQMLRSSCRRVGYQVRKFRAATGRLRCRLSGDWKLGVVGCDH